MNNYEKIKTMSLDEMAEWFSQIQNECTQFCFYGNYHRCLTNGITCKDGILLWLKQDENIDYTREKLERCLKSEVTNDNPKL